MAANKLSTSSIKNPLRHQLPLWSRPGLMGRQGKLIPPQRLPRDRLKSSRQLERTISLQEGLPMKGERVQERVSQLERSLNFLRTQHSDTLKQLHSEIERLKLDNKELNFKLVMCRCGRIQSTTKSRQSYRKPERNDSSETEDELRPFMLEEEVRELQNALQNERSRNSRLMKVIEQRMQQSYDHLDIEGEVVHQDEREDSLTLDEYKTIIQDLRVKNECQTHELNQLKADLQDLLFSDKWTPDAYLIARAYVPDDFERDDKDHFTNNERSRLPQLVQRNDKVKDKAYRRLHESVHLPALTPRLPNPVSERHKRALSLQRTRLGTLTKDHLNFL